MRQGSLSPKIKTLKMAHPHMTNADIARAVGCTPANVTQVLRQVPHFVRSAHFCLSPSEMTFLRKEAKRHEIKLEQMAVLLLRDAIYDAQYGEAGHD